MCNNNNINVNANSRILKDKTKNGKDRPRRDKKLSNITYHELLYILEFKKAFRVKECGELLEFKHDNETGFLKLYKTWFCKACLCALCNCRRSMKHSYQTKRITSEVLKEMTKGFNRLFKISFISNCCERFIICSFFSL